jgi:hypothetical protein
MTGNAGTLGLDNSGAKTHRHGSVNSVATLSQDFYSSLGYQRAFAGHRAVFGYYLVFRGTPDASHVCISFSVSREYIR